MGTPKFHFTKEASPSKILILLLQLDLTLVLQNYENPNANLHRHAPKAVEIVCQSLGSYCTKVHVLY